MPTPDVLIGGRYRLSEPIADGGMSSVWIAWDERLHRRVALKQLHARPGLSTADAHRVGERAMREARITARLHHPHAVPVYDVVDHEGMPCLVMQYLPSKSLQALLTERGTLDFGEVAGIGAEVAGALAAAHAAGIVHRDVKPGNILIDEAGAAKLTDFGISHALGDVTLTTTGMVTGTPAFLAPEVARGQPSDVASDVFALGATLYAALEGSPPFGTDSNPMAVLHRAASGHIAPPQRSGPLTPVLRRMLALDPAERPTMSAVQADLEAVRGGAGRGPAPAAGAPPVSGPPPSTTVTLPPATAAPAAPTPARRRATPLPSIPPAPRAARRPRRGRLAVAAALAVMVLGVLAVVLITRSAGNSGSGGGQAASSGHPSTSGPPSTSAHSTHSSSPATSPTSSAPTTRSSSSRASTTAAAAAGSPAQEVTAYYALLPGGTDQTWPQLTTAYQHATAGGRASYDAFWNSMRSVSTGKVTVTGTDTVEATITYHYSSGKVVDERTSFRLVREGGRWKIADTSVLSSNQR